MVFELTPMVFPGQVITVVPLHAFQLFGIGAGEIGLLFSLGAAVGILLAPIMGSLSDRYGRVPLIVPSALLCGLGCLSVATLQDWHLYVASYMLWSLGEAALAPLLSAYAADIAPKAHVGAAMSLSRQAGDLVAFLAPPLLGFMWDHGHLAMHLTSLVTFLGAASFHRLAPRSPWRGTPDFSSCEPCPEGRVCPVGTGNVSQGTICPEGHVCGEGTTSGAPKTFQKRKRFVRFASRFQIFR